MTHISQKSRHRSLMSDRDSGDTNRNLVTLAVIVMCLHLLLLDVVEIVDAERVTFYEHYGRKGKSLQMNVRKCTALPRKWQELSSSVDTHGSCLTMYERADCTGRYIQLRPETATYVPNLKKTRFNDVISSAKPCRSNTNLPGGRYAIQNVDDKKYLTARNNFRRGYTMIETEPWKRKGVSQQWDVEKNLDGTYWLIPRIHVTRNPLTYDLKNYKAAKYPENGMFPDRMYWILQHSKGSKYLIRNDVTGKCLVLDEEIEEEDCDSELSSHQWAFHRLK